MNKRETGRPAGLTAFHQAMAEIVASLDLDQTLAAIARAVTRVVECDIGAIFLVDEGTGDLVIRATHGSRRPEWDGLRLKEGGVNRMVVRTGRVQRIDDYQALPLEAQIDSPIVQAEPLRSTIVAPVHRRRRRLGAIGGYRREVKPFTRDDEFLLGLLADQAAIALDNAFAYQELAATRSRLEALIALTDAIWRPLPFRQIATLVVAQVARILPGIECLVAVVEPERPHLLEFVAGTPGWAEAKVGTRHLLADTTMAGKVLREGVTLETDHFSEVSVVARQMTGNSGIDTARLVPLLAEESPSDGRAALGILNFYRGGRAPFSAEERALMNEFARRVSVALHRAELLDTARETTARQHEAIEAAADLSESLDPNEVIRRVLARSVTAARADRGVLLRIDGVETVVEDYYDAAGFEDVPGYRAGITSQPLMEKAISTRRPVFGGRYELNPLASPIREAVSSVLHTATLPLVLDDKVVAVLVLSRRDDRIFLPSDLVTLELIANQAALALRNARLFAHAREVSRAQSDFLNMAAHELRTPLSVIAGYVSMLLDGSFGESPPGWRRPIETIQGKARELEELIADLLMASRLEAGRLALAPVAVDLREVTRKAVERARPRARLLNAQLTQRAAPLPVPALADPEHLGRILDNLLNNALTYTAPPGRVRVSIAAGARPGIRVADSGFGIPQVERERIFERFYRIDDPEVRHMPGTGLGLSIGRDLAIRMGGSLELESSQPGKGSVFIVRLPRVPASPAGRKAQ